MNQYLILINKFLRLLVLYLIKLGLPKLLLHLLLQLRTKLFPDLKNVVLHLWLNSMLVYNYIKLRVLSFGWLCSEYLSLGLITQPWVVSGMISFFVLRSHRVNVDTLTESMMVNQLALILMILFTLTLLFKLVLVRIVPEQRYVSTHNV